MRGTLDPSWEGVGSLGPLSDVDTACNRISLLGWCECGCGG